MLEKVKKLIQRPSIYKITFIYESYGPILVSCIVKRPYYKSLGVYAIAGDDESALEGALKLLDEVIALEKKIGCIEVPSLDKQQHVDGYYRKIMHEDYEVEFKRTPNSYNITGINRKDENGFYLCDVELPERYFKIDKDEFHYTDISEYRKLLKEGEELYGWDTIRFLSGSAGLAVVKEGRIIKTKGIAMA